MNDTELKIIKAVDDRREDFIEFFCQLMKSESITGHEQEVADMLLAGMKERGFENVRIVERKAGRPNVVAVYEGNEGGPTCTFNGHLDVLPPQDLCLWKHDPFGAEIEDGKIFGRGTVDMKSGTFSSFFAGIILQDLKLPIKGRVVFTGVCDELVSGRDGVIFLIEEGIIKKEHPDDFGINCEPTNFNEIDMATKGVMRINVTVIGKGAFNARPYLGISAIDKAAKFIEAVQAYNSEIAGDPEWQHSLLAPRSAQVALIEGGEATNLVPERVKMTIMRRLHPGETKEGCTKEIQDIVDRLHKEDPEFTAEVSPWENFRPPVELPLDLPVVSSIAKSLKSVNGEELKIVGSEGGTDASHVVVRTGIPMPVFGPGNDKLLGTVDEHIEIEEFINAIKVYALTIYDMMGEK